MRDPFYGPTKILESLYRDFQKSTAGFGKLPADPTRPRSLQVGIAIERELGVGYRGFLAAYLLTYLPTYLPR